MKRTILTALAVALAATAANAAKPKYIVNFKEGAPLTIAPDQTYILFRTNTIGKLKSDLIFVRDLTPPEVAEYEAAKAKAEAKRAARALSEINLRRQTAGQKPLTELPPQPAAKPLPPVIPYIKNGIPNVVRSQGGKPLIKGVEERTFLMQVPAGTYLIAGTSPSGMVGGTCMCMGSVRFEAKPGQVTDLGTILAAPEDAKVEIAEFRGLTFDDTIKIAPWNLAVRPAGAATARPTGLANANVVAATYMPADKFPNYFGMLVNRMPAMPGLLTYDGDKIVMQAKPAS